MRITRKQIMGACALGGLVLLSGCTRDNRYQPVGMWNSARLEPMEGTPLPNRNTVSRPLPAGTVARGQLAAADPLLTGRTGGALMRTSPIPVTRELLERGQERYNVYCAPCHGRIGDGNGMIVLRGFPPPPDYAIQRLRTASVGHFYDVITNGYGAMYSYAERVPVRDRWAIANYIRVLQGSRPVVAETRQGEREKARLEGIADPNRPRRLPDSPHMPEGGQPGGTAPAHGGPQTGPLPPGQGNPAPPPTHADPDHGGTGVTDPIQNQPGN